MTETSPAPRTASPGPHRRLLALVSSMGLGGKESRLRDVLQRVDRERYEPVLGVLHAGSLLSELAGVEVRPRLARFSGDPLAPLRLLGLVREARPDVIWCVGPGVMAVLGLLTALRSGVPALVSVHGLERSDESVFGPLERRLVHRAARVLILTESYRERLLLEGVRPEQIAVQPNGIDVERFAGTPAPRDESWRELGVRWPGPTLVHVGKLAPAKAQPVLLRALSRLRETRPDVGLVMVGDGPLRGDLERLRDELRLGERVSMPGERRDLHRVLPLFDAFALSSVVEGCPNVAIEAMAAGLPVVATDAGGCREVVADGETGYVVPVGDHEALARALADVLENPARAREMGEAGRRRARRLFTLERMVRDRMQLLDEVVTLGRGAAVAAART